MLNEILTHLGATAVVVAIAAYVLKTWIFHQLQDAELKYAHDLAVKLEHGRAEVAKDIARLNVHEDYLHKKRVDLLEQMYAVMVEAEFDLQQFLVSWWARSNKAELMEKGLMRQQDFDDNEGEPFEKRGVAFCRSYLKINAILHKNALFFDDSFITKVKSAYDPYFDAITNLDYSHPPAIPQAYKDLVNAGRAPRLEVIETFRDVLGVERRITGEA